MRMELDQLRAFLAVSEAGGFTRAATVLASTQPTLSRQVKALETELGRPLFDRLGRHIQTTAFGRSFATRARALLADADALLAAGSDADGDLSGELRLAVADSVVLSRFPRILAHFNRRYPDVLVHIQTATSPQILTWVRNGRCDAGLCMLPQAHPGLALRPLWNDRFIAISTPCDALAGKRVPIEIFAAQRQILISPGTLSHQVLTAAYQSQGLPLVPTMDFDNFTLIAEFVAAGVGVGICSATVAEPYLKAGRVKRVRIAAIDRLTRRLGLVLHADRAASPLLSALVAEIDRQAKRGGKKRAAR
jgi:DNA-binding transcriptional LysR family regulator